MPKNKALKTSNPESIEEAWARGDELAMAKAVVRKYARVLDMTDSGRDIKPLATGMFEAVERVRSLEVKRAEADNPLNRIMTMAEDA
jgi:hypothetical protein